MPEKIKKLNVPTLIAIAILAIQCGLIVRARFDPSRYFCWGMFDNITKYRIEAVVNGKELNAREIAARYGRTASSLDAHSIQHIKDTIAQREQASADAANVRLTYSINGKPEQAWTWAR